MSQVNKYTDNAAYEADETRSKSRSAVSYIEDNGVLRYDGVNVVVGRDAAAEGDLAVYDKADSAIRFVKGATLDADTLPAELVPAAVVYGRRGDRVRVVSLENVTLLSRWAHTYEVALSGFDLQAGGTFVLKLGSGSVAADLSITYAAGATLADVAEAVNAALKGGTIDYSTSNYGGWSATAADEFVVMGSNTYDASRAVIDVVSGCQISFTPENKNYQTTLTGLLIEGPNEYIRRRNGVDSTFAGCNPGIFLQYYSANGVDASGIAPGSGTVIRESAFTQEANPALVEAYPTYRDYLLGEHMTEYPSAYGTMLRDGRENTARIGGLRFTDIYGEEAPCYPAAAAALGYGVTVEGHTTGLEAGAWWLPSAEEMYLLMHDRALTSAGKDDDPVNRTLSALGKSPCYAAEYYPWTSCEIYSSDVFVYNGSAGRITNNGKQAQNAVRPVSVL